MIVGGAQPDNAPQCNVGRSATTRRSIMPINALRFASAAANSLSASFAVEPFGPHTTMAPSKGAHRQNHQLQIEPKEAEQKRDKQYAANSRGDPPRQDEFAAALDLVRE